MSTEELRLQFETFLLQANVEKREQLLTYLKVEAEGQGNDYLNSYVLFVKLSRQLSPGPMIPYFICKILILC